jgi:hypothetical protein
MAKITCLGLDIFSEINYYNIERRTTTDNDRRRRTTTDDTTRQRTTEMNDVKSVTWDLLDMINNYGEDDYEITDSTDSAITVMTKDGRKLTITVTAE